MNSAADKWDVRFIRLAQHIANWSKDPSTQTGAVIVDCDRAIVSMGYNGFPKGIEDTEGRLNDREVKYENMIHGEMNAVLSASQPLHGCTLYTWPFSSCPRCAVHMIQAKLLRCVAPVCPEDRLHDWGDRLSRSRGMFEEAGMQYTEIDLEKNEVVREIHKPNPDVFGNCSTFKLSGRDHV